MFSALRRRWYVVGKNGITGPEVPDRHTATLHYAMFESTPSEQPTGFSVIPKFVIHSQIRRGECEKFHSLTVEMLNQD